MKAMGKGMKKLAAVILAVVMFVTMMPVQIARAEELSDLDLTEEQLLWVYLGNWNMPLEWNLSLSKEEMVISYIFSDKEPVKYTWNFEGTVVKENVALTYEESDAAIWDKIEPTGKVQALHFSNEEYDFYVYREFSLAYEMFVMMVDMVEKASGTEKTTYAPNKRLETEETVSLYDLLPAAKDISVSESTEEPTVEEPAQEQPTVEASGREVLEGESVYVVVKGDCLWSIAKQLLGKGELYKKLFTRNGDIVEQADMIFPGQEIIVPVK